jgi:hypothetical protein
MITTILAYNKQRLMQTNVTLMFFIKHKSLICPMVGYQETKTTYSLTRSVQDSFDIITTDVVTTNITKVGRKEEIIIYD